MERKNPFKSSENHTKVKAFSSLRRKIKENPFLAIEIGILGLVAIATVASIISGGDVSALIHKFFPVRRT